MLLGTGDKPGENCGSAREVRFVNGSRLFCALLNEPSSTMRSRVRLYVHVAATLVAFATLGSAPRITVLSARDLPSPRAVLEPEGDGGAGG
jgi:hypothetical protein